MLRLLVRVLLPSWAISPALPSGLSFGTSNGTIWGTPTTIRSLRTYTIWANNSGGSSSATVNITVNDELRSNTYFENNSPRLVVLTNNTAMSPTATPTNSGGAVPSTIIDSTGNVGEYSSIVIDSYGFKHISYYDATNTKLKYATDKSGSWVHTTVNTTSIPKWADTPRLRLIPRVMYTYPMSTIPCSSNISCMQPIRVVHGLIRLQTW